MARAIVGSRGPLLAAVALLSLTAQLQAGPIFVPGQLEGDKFTPAPGVPCHCASIKYSTTNVTVENETARVRVEESIEGPEKAVPAVGLIPLPEGTVEKELVVYFGTINRLPPVHTQFLSADKAQKVYETLAKGTGLTKFLALTGKPAILVPSVNLQGKQLFVYGFTTPVNKTQGVNTLNCPMPAAAWSGSPVERLTLSVKLNTKDPLRTVFSPTHNATVTRKGLNEATATVKADHWSGLDDFRLFWVADKDDLGLRVLAYKGVGKEDGFFMLLGNPTGAAAERDVEKDVILVLDTSGSMRGEKIEQARSALDYCLEHLNKGDRFNVITFGSTVKTFRNDLVDLTGETQKAAREFVENVVAHGQTNISGALEKALAGKATEGRERIMIFLTDGAPTVGERVPDKILEQVKKLNTTGTKIFVMGVGHDVNAHLLDHLAEVTDGSSEYVAPREELDAKVAALYDRLSHPVLSGVKVSFGEASTKSVLPSKLPVLFKGSEIMMVGRYKEGGKHTFTISGSLSGKPTKYTVDVTLPKEAGDGSNEFLAPLWAARQIGYLLQEIRLHGGNKENKELIEEIVRLSKQYGIVTEYTDFIAMGGVGGGPGAPGAPGMYYAEAAKRLALARGEQAGQWAVNQAANDKALQGKAFGGADNTFRDRRGNLQALRTVTQIGQRAFYLQDGQWVDADEPGTRKVRVVKLFSPEYMELLKTDPMFAKAQQLGWALSINIGEERIVVEKEGKQKDDSLKIAPQPGDNNPFPGGPNQLEQQIPGKRGDRNIELPRNIDKQLQNQLPLNRQPNLPEKP
jgi:Ca-activated chloride channel family protein